MKKLGSVLLLLNLLPIVFSPVAYASENGSEIWLGQVMEGIDGDTSDILEKMGITGSEGISELTPEKVISVLSDLFGTSLRDTAGDFCAVTAVILITAVFVSLAGEGKTAEIAVNVGNLVIVFVLITLNSRIFIQCRAAIELTKDMMLGLLPVLTGIVAFSGKPSLALSFNTVVFSFAQTVSLGFCNILPAVSVLGTALGAATAIAPFGNYGGLCKIITKTVTFLGAFVSGIFVAVLSVRGVIAGAADTVTAKGLRFLIGSSVPIVGSAIGDALNSITAGLGLVKNSALIIGVAAVAVINIVPLVKTALWSLLSYCTGMIAEMLSLKRITAFTECIRNVLSVLTAVICFNTFVYVISCAILVTVGE